MTGTQKQILLDGLQSRYDSLHLNGNVIPGSRFKFAG